MASVNLESSHHRTRRRAKFDPNCVHCRSYATWCHDRCHAGMASLDRATEEDLRALAPSAKLARQAMGQSLAWKFARGEVTVPERLQRGAQLAGLPHNGSRAGRSTVFEDDRLKWERHAVVSSLGKPHTFRPIGGAQTARAGFACPKPRTPALGMGRCLTPIDMHRIRLPRMDHLAVPRLEGDASISSTIRSHQSSRSLLSSCGTMEKSGVVGGSGFVATGSRFWPASPRRVHSPLVVDGRLQGVHSYQHGNELFRPQV